jgi:hypothetical protein
VGLLAPQARSGAFYEEWHNILALLCLPFLGGFPNGFPKLYVQVLPLCWQRSHNGRAPEQRTLQRWHWSQALAMLEPRFPLDLGRCVAQRDESDWLMVHDGLR